jgi:glycosyltransferase involved in cell wall biosynthesis
MNQERVTGNPISLIFPRSSSPDELLTILMDVQQFFSKWPSMPEIFVPFLPPPAATANTLTRLPPKGLQLLNNAGLGFGAAVREGIKRSKADFSFVLDLPLEFPLADVFQAWMEFESRPEIDIVVGSRRLPKSARLKEPKPWAWRWDSWLNDRMHQHVGSDIVDMTTSFYAYRNERVKPLSEEIRENGFSFAARLMKKAEQDRLKISEKPVHWNPTPDSLPRFARDQWSLLKMTFV